MASECGAGEEDLLSCQAPVHGADEVVAVVFRQVEQNRAVLEEVQRASGRGSKC